MRAAAQATGTPLRLVLACAIAESGLNPYAERWGTETAAAKTAIAASRWTDLAAILSRAWPDVSFGYGQQIVLYHYLGDRSPTVSNCLSVRTAVFADPGSNILDMAKRLRSNLDRAASADLRPVGGDPELGALVIYNAGSLKPPGDPWWDRWAGNVASYRRAQDRARRLLNE